MAAPPTAMLPSAARVKVAIDNILEVGMRTIGHQVCSTTGFRVRMRPSGTFFGAIFHF
jgi:hypothetical protein